MDNHPIPQDVTGFKFKLIGSVTVKQFAYLLVASVICYILYALPGNYLFRLPFMLIVALIGIGLAFIPIDGRPMDLMLWYLIKAVPQDNQYIYRKSGIALPIMQILKLPVFKRGQPSKNQKPEEEKVKIRKKAPFIPQSTAPNLTLEPHEENFLASILNIFDTTSVSTIKQPPQPIMTREKPQSKPKIKKETLKKDFFASKTPASPLRSLSEGGSPLEKQQSKTLTDEEILQGKYLELAKQQTPLKSPDISKDSSRVQFLTSDEMIKAGFPLLPDTPNIILGIIKDPRGKVLPNILVEVYDKNNIPVRAFKTNQLGQFISATPLPTGIYTIRLEDPMKRNEFDTIKIELKGEICQPIEVTSIDEREKLRQELFEN